MKHTQLADQTIAKGDPHTSGGDALKVDLSVGTSEQARARARGILHDDCEDFIENAKPEEIRFLRDVLVTWRLNVMDTDLPIAEAFNMIVSNLPHQWLRVNEEHYRATKKFAEGLESGKATVPVGEGWHIWKNPRFDQKTA